ncbi:hypothetical protein M0804_015142 [Polistes exclamans]|nr:hypothetical protein M0804_015142 [Polistes exclamans]
MATRSKDDTFNSDSSDEFQFKSDNTEDDDSALSSGKKNPCNKECSQAFQYELMRKIVEETNRYANHMKQGKHLEKAVHMAYMD